MESLGWRQRRGSSPAARRGARQRAGLTAASASNTLLCERETLHQKPNQKYLDGDHGIYRGSNAVFQDLMGGQIDISISSWDGLPLVRAGSLKAYAATSNTRWTAAPDIPTFAELGFPQVSMSLWNGLFAPKGTPKDVIAKLNAAVAAALADPTVQSRLVELGMEIFPREQQTPEALAAMVKADAEKWWPIIKELGIKAE